MLDTSGPLQFQPGDPVLLCSDGLWGSIGDPTIVQMLADRPISDAVPELAEQALRQAGAKSDNVTVLAVEWEGAEPQDNPQAVSTRSLGDEVFASTIQASLAAGEAQGDELDDAQIERSDRAVNTALKRNAQTKS